MNRTVAVTLSADRLQKVIEGEALEINIPPDAGKLIVKCKQDVFAQMLSYLLRLGRK